MKLENSKNINKINLSKCSVCSDQVFWLNGFLLNFDNSALHDHPEKRAIFNKCGPKTDIKAKEMETHKIEF